jgi:SAM-dependent methyltransferase
LYFNHAFTPLKPWFAQGIGYRIVLKLRELLTRQIVRERLRAFVATYRTEECILDLGCGNSNYTKYFPNRIGIDIVSKAGISVVGDAHNLPFRANAFSMILSTEMLEHVQEPQRVIDEIQRILKPEGKLVLTTRFIFPLHDTPNDFYRFTQYGLGHLFRGWSHFEITPEAGSFETFGVLLQRMAFQCDFYVAHPVRFFLLITARLVRILSALIKVQYGNAARTMQANQILVSGWYVVAEK